MGSESSGVVSGLTSSQASCSNSAATIPPSPRDRDMADMEDIQPTTTYDRLKSAMVSQPGDGGISCLLT